MSEIINRKFKCTGCGEARPCYLETNKESSIFDLYTEDKLTCVLDVTNRTGFNWEEVEANGVTTGEKQCNLPVVSNTVCSCGNKLTEKEIFYETCLVCMATVEQTDC